MEKAFICLKFWHIEHFFFGWIPEVSFYYVHAQAQCACIQKCFLVYIFYMH